VAYDLEKFANKKVEDEEIKELNKGQNGQSKKRPSKSAK
jgi:hypothetical protein